MKGHARNLMREDVRSVTADTALADVGRLFVAVSVSGVPVVDEHHAVLGFISRHAMLDAVLAGAVEGRVARDLMSSPAVVVDEFMATDDVLRLLREKGVHHLPVVRDARLVGIITAHDILKYCVGVLLPIPQDLA